MANHTTGSSLGVHFQDTFMPLSSTVRLAALLATLVRSDISLSVGDAGIELSSTTSRNLSKAGIETSPNQGSRAFIFSSRFGEIF